jgi:hypothetical protein
VSRQGLLLGLAAVFAGIAAVTAISSLVYATPVPLAVAAPTGATAYVFWYQGTGRLQRRVRRRPFDARAGPRGAFDARAGFGGRAAGAGARRERYRPPASSTRGPTRSEAAGVLGVEVGAGEREVRRAYRKRVKEVHPDRGGDERQFKRVAAAYDRLTE